jgi:DNA-binding CsgD family transcriptional regulator
MLDVQKLKGKMVEKGKSVESISAEMGINPATFYRKLKNNSFEINEASKIVELLSLTNEEAIAIFLHPMSQKCDK